MYIRRSLAHLLIFVIFVFLLVTIAYAEGEIVDPNVTPNYTVTCVHAVEREPNSSGVSVPLPLSEIARIDFYVSTDKGVTNPWTLADTDNSNACSQTYDLSTVPDGQYYYTTKTVDNSIPPLESIYSADSTELLIGYHAVVIKRVPMPPKPSGGFGGTARP